MAFVYSAFLALSAFLLAGKAKDEPFAPVDAAYGYDSSVTQPQVSIAQDQAGWNQLWAAHRGTSGATLPSTLKLADDRPPVDFKKHFVVGIFGGTMQEVEGYTVSETVTDGTSAFVRFVPVPSILRQEIPRVTQPYGFVILPRTKLKLEIQVPKGRDQWRTVAQFAPTIVEAKKKG